MGDPLVTMSTVNPVSCFNFMVLFQVPCLLADKNPLPDRSLPHLENFYFEPPFILMKYNQVNYLCCYYRNRGIMVYNM